MIPTLQVPKLSVSLSKFLAAVRPLLTETESSRTFRVADNFLKNEGPYLQNSLLELAKEKYNWASHVFVYQKFLRNRSSLLNTHTALYLTDHLTCKTTEDWLTIASNYIFAYLSMLNEIRTGRMSQETSGEIPLCMSQYQDQLGACRIPGPNVDMIQFSPESQHIVIMCSGFIYKMPVYTYNELIAPHQIYSLLKQIVQRSNNHGPSLSLLTALDRSQWCSARNELLKSKINETSLGIIETSLFGVCLEERLSENAPDALKLALAGNGSCLHNFWFDLGNHLVITKDCYLGIVYEHAIRDGALKTPIECTFNDEITLHSELDIDNEIEELTWDLSDRLTNYFALTQKIASGWSDGCDFSAYDLTELGREAIKNCNINVQGFIHTAIHLAHYRLYDRPVNSYQPVSLRKFKHGRLEHPLTLSREVLEFVEEMRTPGAQDRKIFLLRRAAEEHQRILQEASNGLVYAKHLIALEMLAVENGVSVELFRDKSFYFLATNDLLISYIHFKKNIQVLTVPAGRRGHAILTNSRPTGISISTFSPKNGFVSALRFAELVGECLIEIEQLMKFHNTSR